MKIAVAMSGGVDSSVAAALMTEKYGKENVFGVTMKLYCYGEAEGSDKSCCSLDAIGDAAAVCKQLGVRHYIINLEKEFKQDVIDDFVAGYETGLTPNPCVRCNQLVKYEHLLRKVQELGADLLVTGHYARISKTSPVILNEVKDPGLDSSVTPQNDDGVYHLLKGLDPLKDQSYFLYNLTQEQLSYLEFPVGELTKVETRALANKYGLKTAEKTESQDICFVTSSVQDFLSDKIVLKPGNIVVAPSCHSREGGNPDFTVGKIVGRHNGLQNYTIGQRKGLGGGFSEIMYVTGLNIENNAVVIGPEEALFGNSLIVERPHWIVDEPASPLRCTAKIRYASEAAACTVSCSEEHTLEVTFSDPQKAITPGQSVVFYDGDEVLGGGVISA